MESTLVFRLLIIYLKHKNMVISWVVISKVDSYLVAKHVLLSLVSHTRCYKPMQM